MDDFVLDAFDVDYIDIAALLWQTGYLTFDKKIEELGTILYKFKVPNREIQMSLNTLFLDYLTNLKNKALTFRSKLYDCLRQGNMELFKDILHCLFASIPYSNYANNIIQRYEGYYASVVYAYVASLGFRLIPEDVTNKGQVDMTVFADHKVYVMEFKVDSESGKALEQIKEKGYHEKYLGSAEEVYLVGIEFSSKERNVAGFEYIELKTED